MLGGGASATEAGKSQAAARLARLPAGSGTWGELGKMVGARCMLSGGKNQAQEGRVGRQRGLLGEGRGSCRTGQCPWGRGSCSQT